MIVIKKILKIGTREKRKSWFDQKLESARENIDLFDLRKELVEKSWS